jgi:hypothetical protein
VRQYSLMGLGKCARACRQGCNLILSIDLLHPCIASMKAPAYILSIFDVRILNDQFLTAAAIMCISLYVLNVFARPHASSTSKRILRESLNCSLQDTTNNETHNLPFVVLEDFLLPVGTLKTIRLSRCIRVAA